MHQYASIENAHSGAIHALKWSKTGNYILSGGQDRTVNLWNATSRTNTCQYRQHAYEVLDIAVSHDDAKFASVGGDRTAYLWNVSRAEVEQRFSSHTARINCAAFNDQSTVLVTGSFDTTVRLWDCRSTKRTPLQTLSEATDSVSSVAVTDHSVIAGSVDGRLRIYDLRVFKAYTDLVGPAITDIRLVGDGTIAVMALDSTIRRIKLDTGSTVEIYKGHDNTQLRINCAVMVKDNTILAGSENGKMYKWNLDSGEIVDKVDSACHALDVHRDRVISAGQNTIQLWE